MSVIIHVRNILLDGCVMDATKIIFHTHFGEQP